MKPFDALVGNFQPLTNVTKNSISRVARATSATVHKIFETNTSFYVE